MADHPHEAIAKLVDVIEVLLGQYQNPSDVREMMVEVRAALAVDRSTYPVVPGYAPYFISEVP